MNNTTASEFTMAKLQDIMREAGALFGHPKAIDRIREITPVFEEPEAPFSFRVNSYLNSLPLYRSEHVPETRKTGKALFPKDPFVEYDDADRVWAVPLGIATEETETVFYVVQRPSIGFIHTASV